MKTILNARSLLACLALIPLTIVPAHAAKPAAKQAVVKAGSGSCTKLTASGLGYSVLKKGTGVKPGARDKVTINYRGTLAKTGAEFDANQGTRFAVTDVIPGFAEGLQLIPVGAKYRLCIPAKLGYGGQVIEGVPANSDLVFDVDMVAVTPAPPMTLASKAERMCAQKTASGLGYQLIEVPVKATAIGATNMPTNDHYVLVGYAGYLAADGSKFDENSGAAFAVTGVVPGFSEGLKLMHKGERYRLCIPAALGYGTEGTGPIPPNSDLVFLVELIDLRSTAEIKALEDAEAKKTGA
jgi:FKBP-type peptidyl-prolyl cis-trans isomerase